MRCSIKAGLLPWPMQIIISLYHPPSHIHNIYTTLLTSDSVTMTSLSAFHRFPNLPAEIRAMIWWFCLPRRLHHKKGFNTGGGVCYANVHGETCGRHRAYNTAPIVSQVCHESRNEVFRHGRYLNLRLINNQEERTVTTPNADLVWFQPQLDIISLHPKYQPKAPVPMETNGCGVCIRSELLLPHRFTPDLMDSSFDYDFGDRDDMDSTLDLVELYHLEDTDTVTFHDIAADIIALKGRAECDVIIRDITIHAPRASAQQSDFFGLLGDAPTRLIDPDDKTSLQALVPLLKESAEEFWWPRWAEKFEHIISNADNWKHYSRNIQLLRKSYTKIWVWCWWQRDRQIPSSPLLDFDQVWVHEAQQTTGKLDTPNSITVPEFSYPPVHEWWAQEIRGRSPNPENPWVAKTIEAMPMFQPKMSVRYCGPAPPPRPPGRRWRSVIDWLAHND